MSQTQKAFAEREEQRSFALLRGALNEENRKRFDAMPIEEKRWLVNEAFKDGVLTYGPAVPQPAPTQEVTLARLNRTDLYEVIDMPPVRTRERAGVDAGFSWKGRIKARWTGEKRPPRKGEFYLSGALIEAYRAPNDLSTPYHIAELVSVERMAQPLRVVEVLPLEAE